MGAALRRGFDWEAAGATLGATLSGVNAVVVVGVDPVATGHVALGIGRAQARARRVAVGDLFAESPPIQELVTSEDPHGLVDCFLYGVSMTRIAYAVPDAGELYVMPSGTEPPDYQEMLPNPRWERLAAGFREVDALLVLAAPASAPRIETLVAALDGVVLVGDAVPRKVPVARVIGSVREPRADSASDVPAGARPPESAAATNERARGAPARRWRAAAALGVVLTIGLAWLAFWLATRPISVGGRPSLGRKPDTSAGHAPIPAPVSLGTADTTPPTPIVASPAVANLADSTGAAAFSVELIAANTEAGAILKLQEDGKQLPAATFAPIEVQGTRWFKVTAGAFTGQAGADSLLASLRHRGLVDAGAGTVVELPFAFLIDSGVPATAVPGMLAAYADRGQPVYALRQPNGSAWLLAGAFESPTQAALYAESLRASGMAPVLVYRKGRAF